MTSPVSAASGHTGPASEGEKGAGARAAIFARVRAATSTAAGRAGSDAGADTAYAALPRNYLAAHHDPAEHDLAELFTERAADRHAIAERVGPGELAETIARVLRERAAALAGAEPPAAAAPPARFIVPAGLPQDWLSAVTAGVQLVSDDQPLSNAELDAAAGVITNCAVAIAETGTIVLGHGAGQGRRALTLVPDFHLAVVESRQIAPDLTAALTRLDPACPHTLVSGPSATSDVELVRVKGVHGPRTLRILIV